MIGLKRFSVKNLLSCLLVFCWLNVDSWSLALAATKKDGLTEVRISNSEAVPLPPGDWELEWKGDLKLCEDLGKSCSELDGRGVVLSNTDPQSPLYALAIRYTSSSGRNWSDLGCYGRINRITASHRDTSPLAWAKYFDDHGTRSNSLVNKCSFGTDEGLPIQLAASQWTPMQAAFKGFQEPKGEKLHFEILVQAEGRRRFQIDAWLIHDNGNQIIPGALLMQWKELFVEKVALGAFGGVWSSGNTSVAPLNFINLSDAKKILNGANIDSDNDIQLLMKLNELNRQLSEQEEAGAGQSSLLETNEKIVAIQALMAIGSKRLEALNELSRPAVVSASMPTLKLETAPPNGQGLNARDDTKTAAVQAETKVDSKPQLAQQKPAELASLTEPSNGANNLPARSDIDQLPQPISPPLAPPKVDQVLVAQSEYQSLKAQLQRMQDEISRLKQTPVTELPKPPPPKPNSSNKRFGLVFGNARYAYVPALKTSTNDAQSFAAELSELGFKVSLHLDLGERDFNKAVRKFKEQLSPDDEVVFFYAGHGVQFGGVNFLLPTDVGSESADQVKDESIELQKVLDSLSEKKARFTLAIVDACRDNPFKSTVRAIGGRGLAPTTAANGQMIIFSAGAGQQALDTIDASDKDPNGLFTRIFLREMKKPGVPIDKMLRNVRQEVYQIAKNIGHDQVPALYDQTIGEFYFKLNSSP